MTKASVRYFQTFGVEASIETLKELSGYSVDEIWLFSVELFAKEVTKFNMKVDAETKEAKAEFEKIQQEYESKSK